jgi:hypothetical protein
LRINADNIVLQRFSFEVVAGTRRCNREGLAKDVCCSATGSTLSLKWKLAANLPGSKDDGNLKGMSARLVISTIEIVDTK